MSSGESAGSRVPSIRVTTKDIRTDTTITPCDVCGRTLLFGEIAQVYLDGSARRSVCELCTTRAVSEGWVREGTVPPYEGRDGGSERRRSWLGRRRRRREKRPEAQPEVQAVEFPAAPDDLLASGADTPAPVAEVPAESGDLPIAQVDSPLERGERSDEQPPRQSWTKSLRRVRGRSRADQPPGRARDGAREPRHVRAVPTSVEHKIASAVEVFNRSEHQRTVAGVARSLGPPAVVIRPVQETPSQVNVIVSWELCWYRYAIDLSEDIPSVRVDAQGYELDELQPSEQRANAVSDEHGSLTVRGT